MVIEPWQRGEQNPAYRLSAQINALFAGDLMTGTPPETARYWWESA